jgi:hypothetical protein
MKRGKNRFVVDYPWGRAVHGNVNIDIFDIKNLKIANFKASGYDYETLNKAVRNIPYEPSTEHRSFHGNLRNSLVNALYNIPQIFKLSVVDIDLSKISGHFFNIEDIAGFVRQSFYKNHDNLKYFRITFRDFSNRKYMLKIKRIIKTKVDEVFNEIHKYTIYKCVLKSNNLEKEFETYQQVFPISNSDIIAIELKKVFKTLEGMR